MDIGLQLVAAMDELSDQPKVTFEPDGSVSLDPDGSGRVGLAFYNERHFERWTVAIVDVIIRRNGGLSVVPKPTTADQSEPLPLRAVAS